MNYPTKPILIEKVNYKGYEDESIYLSRFVHKNIPVLFIGSADLGEIYAICNLNLEDYELKDFEFAVKSYSENEGMLEWLIKNNYVKEPHFSIPSGFVDIPICYATDRLKEFMVKCSK